MQNLLQMREVYKKKVASSDMRTLYNTAMNTS